MRLTHCIPSDGEAEPRPPPLFLATRGPPGAGPVRNAFPSRGSRLAVVFERNGYTLEGRFRDQIVKDGELLDGLLYAILVSDFRS